MRLDNVSFRYQRRSPWVLADVDAEFGAGDVVRLVGGNGAGKSTLLQLIGGLLRPVRGAVTGRAARFGYAPEKFPAGQPFTVLGYLERLAAMRQLRGRSGTAEVRRWVDVLMLTAFTHEKLENLSKGTAQKVGLAQAMLGSPELVLLDEPWSGLDAAARDAVPGLISQVILGGGSVVFSDHSQQLGGVGITQQWQLSRGGITAAARPPKGPADLAALRVEVPQDQALELAAELNARGFPTSRLDDGAPR